MKQYYIYITTNLINNKKYIEKHFGELNDNYLGSGKNIKLAIEKYGKENFSKQKNKSLYKNYYWLNYDKSVETNCKIEIDTI